MLPMKQWHNVIRVSRSELEETFLNDCDEDAVDYVADGHRPPVLDLTGKSVVREEMMAAMTWVTVAHITRKVKRTKKTEERS